MSGLFENVTVSQVSQWHKNSRAAKKPWVFLWMPKGVDDEIGRRCVLTECEWGTCGYIWIFVTQGCNLQSASIIPHGGQTASGVRSQSSWSSESAFKEHHLLQTQLWLVCFPQCPNRWSVTECIQNSFWKLTHWRKGYQKVLVLRSVVSHVLFSKYEFSPRITMLAVSHAVRFLGPQLSELKWACKATPLVRLHNDWIRQPSNTCFFMDIFFFLP